MWRTILACVLLVAAATANAQQVDYVKRSDLWAYSMGKEAGKLGGQAVGFNDYLRGLEQQQRKLEELKQRLAQCGSCADRGRLAAEVNQLEDKLDKEEGALCGSFMAAQEDFNPAVGAMNKLFGVSSMCARLNEERTKAMAHGIYKMEKQRLAARLKAGDVTAYQELGMITKTTFGHLPENEQLSLACPYWFKGAEMGDRISMSQLVSQCLGASASDGERQEAFDMIKRCADRGTPYCISSLAYFYASPRQANVPASVVTNDKEALRLWDLAAAKDSAYGQREAAALRVKLGLATATPPEPAQRLPGQPAPWVLKEGRYTAKGKDAQGRPYEGFCTIVALGNDRYQFSWSIGSEARTATVSVRGSGVVDPGSGVTLYNILNTPGLALLSAPNETLTLSLSTSSAAATGGVVTLPLVPPNAPVRVTERFDRSALRCAQMAKSVEEFRIRAEKRPELWVRPYAKAQQDYALQCPAQ